MIRFATGPGRYYPHWKRVRSGGPRGDWCRSWYSPDVPAWDERVFARRWG